MHVFDQPIKGNAIGFTLLETMVALGLLSLVILFSTTFLVTVIQTNTFSQNRSGALALAQDKLEDLRANSRSKAQNETEFGITSGNMKTLFCRETVVSRAPGEGSTLVAVKVTWTGPRGNQPHQVQLATQLAE